jgi:FMN phosphatase YigB (HAD superfamily)
VTGLTVAAPRILALDVGNVIYHDEPFTVAWLYEIHCALNGMVAEWDLLSACGASGAVAEDTAAALRDLVGDGGQALSDSCWEAVRARWTELVVPVAGAVEAVGRLAEDYEVVIVANQPPECRTALRRLGLLDVAGAVVLDCEVGLSKPDPGLLLHALATVGAERHEALVVGDRLDNDIVPALALGIRAVQVRAPRCMADAVGVPPSFTTTWRTVRRDQADPVGPVDSVTSLAELANRTIR